MLKLIDEVDIVLRDIARGVSRRRGGLCLDMLESAPGPRAAGPVLGKSRLLARFTRLGPPVCGTLDFRRPPT